MEVEMSKEEFLAWKNDKVTKEIYKVLEHLRNESSEKLALGLTLSSTAVQDTAQEVGFIRGLDTILMVEEEFSGEEE